MEEEWIPIQRSADVNADEQKHLIYSWIYSPSGLYAVDFDYKEIPQDVEEPETHCFLVRFFVLDILEKIWCPYTTNTGPFKRYYSFYWLGDQSAVLLDFTKRDSSVRQNVLYFDHKEKVVTCNIIKNIEFNVDIMCYSRDFIAQKFFYSNEEFLLLCGYRNTESGMVCRMVPYYPYMNISLPVKEFIIDTRSIIRSLTFDDEIRVGGHPFVFGTTLIFLLHKRNPSRTLHYINYTLLIDLAKALNGGERHISPKHARMHTFFCTMWPQWLPTFKSIPNLYNTGEMVILWEDPKRNLIHRSDERRRLFVLDFKSNALRLLYTPLFRKDFACLHPDGSLHIFKQTRKGMKMQLKTWKFHLYSLESLCRQQIFRSTSVISALPSSLPPFADCAREKCSQDSQ